MKILVKILLTTLLLLSIFSSAQGFEKYLGETITDVKKLLDQDKIEYFEKIDSKKLPYLTWKVESGYVKMTIVIAFTQEKDVISNKIILRMPNNTSIEKEITDNLVTRLTEKEYEQLADTNNLIFSIVFKSTNNDVHKKEHYLLFYEENYNKTSDAEKDDFYFFADYILDLKLISK